MVSHRSKILRRHSSLLHPSFRRAPEEGTAGLRNPASCDPVRERGDQVFGESSRSTADSDHFPNDDFFPDIGNLFLDDDMAQTGDNTAATTAAATYASLSHLYQISLQFLCLVLAVDWICFPIVLDICMLALVASVMINFMIFRIKPYDELLIYSTIQKPDYRQFATPAFLTSTKPDRFKGVNYKRWRTRAVLWFQSMNCYAATKGMPEGDLEPAQREAFERVDIMFKTALLGIIDDSIVDPYMSFDNGKDMWAALEAKFGVSDAGSELYVMEQFYDYKMTDERSVVQQAHEIQSLAKELEHF